MSIDASLLEQRRIWHFENRSFDRNQSFALFSRVGTANRYRLHQAHWIEDATLLIGFLTPRILTSGKESVRTKAYSLKIKKQDQAEAIEVLSKATLETLQLLPRAIRYTNPLAYANGLKLQNHICNKYIIPVTGINKEISHTTDFSKRQMERDCWQSTLSSNQDSNPAVPSNTLNQGTHRSNTTSRNICRPSYHSKPEQRIHWQFLLDNKRTELLVNWHNLIRSNHQGKTSNCVWF